MSRSGPHSVGTAASRYFRYGYHPNNSRLQYARWAITLPVRSRVGAAAIARTTRGPQPESWSQDFAGKRALVVGSGPSLDKVDDAFFDGFDPVIYINFALNRARHKGSEYFFTTDSGPIREYIDKKGDADDFARLGPQRCIYAPVFQDQWQGFTPEGRALLTWIGCDAAAWRSQKVRLGPLSLPLVLRYAPRQPVWSDFTLPAPGRRQPVLDHTSALSAVLFAAVNGAREIGLIGCDFSAGRALAAGSDQPDPGTTFSGAAAELGRMAEALKRQGITVVNHSWTV